MKKGEFYINKHKYCECDYCNKSRLFLIRYTQSFYDGESYDTYSQEKCLVCELRYKYYDIKHLIKRFKDVFIIKYRYKVPFHIAIKMAK